ncbi:lipopolysaccharide biosynthesis protein [Mucilaginibacter sp. AW1-3]
MEKSTLAKRTEDNEISLRDIILKLRRGYKFLLLKWKVILIAGLLGGAVGIGYALLKKPIYKAELTFALEDNSTGGLSGTIGLASQLGIDIGGGGGGGVFSGDNLMQLMQSRAMIEKTLLTPVNISGKTQTLAEYYISFNNFRDIWNTTDNLKNIRFLPDEDRSKFTLQKDSILGQFYKVLATSALAVEKKDKGGSITSVKVTSGNELFAKLFAETLTQTVSDFYIDTKTKKSAKNVAILQHQTDSIRQELNQAIIGVASSMDDIPNANPNRLVLKTKSQRRQVDVQADQAILSELVRNLEVSKMALRKETPLIQIIDRPILPLEKTKIRKLIALIAGGIAGGVLAIVILVFKKLSANFVL